MSRRKLTTQTQTEHALWRAQIEQSINGVRSSVEYSRQEVMTKIGDVDKNLTEIKAGVEELKQWKDGDSSRPGVNVRLDRLERTIQVMIWMGGIVAVAAIGAITLAAMNILAEAMSVGK